MIIFHTGNSPYARIARVAAHQCGVSHSGGHLGPGLVRTDNNPVLQYSPTGRIPTLVDGDVVVTETRAVCRYLESIGDGYELFAYAGDWTAEMFENTAMSFLDGCMLWAREKRRDAALQSDWLFGVERARAERALAWFEALPAIQAGDTPWDFAHMTLAVALGELEPRGLIPDWRDGYAALAAWEANQAARPAMQAEGRKGDPQ
jgi:glutathione S-transferase